MKPEDDELEYMRKEALKEYLGISADDSELEPFEKDGTYLQYGRMEYRVLTDEEADKAFRDAEYDSIDETGLDGFSDEFQQEIISFHLNTDWFADAMRESYKSYAEGIKDESDPKFGNRLAQEMYDSGVIDDSCFEKDEDGNPDYGSPIDSKIDSHTDDFVEYLCREQGNPVVWFKSNFGSDELNSTITAHELVDWDSVIQDVKSADGRGSTLASYDGEENKQDIDGMTFYIYRIN